MMLSTHVIPAFDFEAVGSTNTEARKLLEAGHKGPFWVRASEQLTGRGRSGRSWESRPGNHYGSLLIPVSLAPDEAPLIALVAGVAVYDAIHHHCPKHARAELVLKWPNDVLHDGRKMAGLLLETVFIEGQLSAVILGIGVNCAFSPTSAGRPAASLADLGRKVDPLTLNHTLSRFFSNWYDRFTTEGFAVIREAWLQRTLAVGHLMQVKLPGETVNGTFLDLTSSGALLLETEAGIHRQVTAGDVFLP